MTFGSAPLSPTGTVQRWGCWVCLLGLAGCNDYDIIQQPMRETFYQAERDKVDLVFVVDDSPSMLEEAGQLRIASDALLRALINLEVDVQVHAAAMSTGTVFAGLPVDSTAQLEALVDQIAVAPEGAREEPGLDVAVDVTGTIREDAVLHVVLLSDEDDQSPEDVATLVDQLASHAPMGLRVHSIAGDLPAGCARAGVAADPAPRYREATERTGGRAWSICSPTLPTDIGDLSFELTGLARHFPLRSLPDPGSIRVWVAGAQVPPSAVHGWRWSPAESALVFDGLAIPPPAARVDVEYRVSVPKSADGLRFLPEGAEQADSG